MKWRYFITGPVLVTLYAILGFTLWQVKSSFECGVLPPDWTILALVGSGAFAVFGTVIWTGLDKKVGKLLDIIEEHW